MLHLYNSFFLDTPKNEKSMSAVTLFKETIGALKRHREEQNLVKAQSSDRYEELDLVFRTRYGTPLSPNTLLDAHYALIEKAGVPRIKFHALRHTHATQLLIAGVDLAHVSDRLRHSDRATTLRFYARPVEMQRAKIAAISEKIFAEDEAAA